MSAGERICAASGISAGTRKSSGWIGAAIKVIWTAMRTGMLNTLADHRRARSETNRFVTGLFVK